MKRKILLLCGVFPFFIINSLTAQEYEQLTVASGYNADVIANGAVTAAASTTMAVDNANFAFMSADFAPPGMPAAPSSALPVNGLIQSLPTPGLTYQLADYDVNNSLRIHGTTAPSVTTGTLTFSNQVNATKLYVLTTSGSGVATITTTINFTDATSQVITGSTVPDWFNSTVLPIAASGFGRVNTTNNVIENPTGNPRMYQLTLNIDAENQIKEIESIEFTKTSTTEGVVNIFGVTAELLASCPAPVDVTSVSGVSDATVTWAEPVILPGTGYDYYFSTDTTAPTDTTTPTGNVATGTTTVALSDLIIGETYYFWIRSVCNDDDASVWVLSTFTTGQTSETYDDGIINTLYNTLPSVTSTTSCPGVMTISVPDGYQVAEVATSYSMTTASNGYKSEQRSLLYCTNTNTSESSIYSGTGTGGTQLYNRSGLTFANGATGDVEFELRAWRTYGGSGCNATWNKVDNNSWTVTVTYECTTPLTPHATDQALCTGSTVADLAAETDYDNAVLRWYADETGGEQLTETMELTPGTYYVSQYRYTCESERQPVVVTLGTAVMPTTEISQTLCAGTAVSDLFVEPVTNGTITWYGTAAGDDMLTEDTMLSTGSYFVSQTVDGCESERMEVAVTVNETPAPTANTQTVCNGTLVSGLSAEGEENASFNWYATSDSEDVLTGETMVETGSYFVSQTVEGCESARIEVAVTTTTTAIPTANTEQTYCSGAIIGELLATPIENATLSWYATANSETALSETDMLITGSYFVSQTVDGCESERMEVAVTVNATPNVPEGNAVQGFDMGDTLASLTINVADGAVVNWYVLNAEMEFVAVDATTELVDGNTYYVSQTLENCESEYFAITMDAAMSTPMHNTTALKIYPNPANNLVNITNNNIIENVEVINVLGQNVMSQHANSENVQLNISSLAAGTYILAIYPQNGAVTTVKVIKQ